MAKIRPTSPFEDIRGRMGGLVFSSNKTGSYVKRLVVPTQRLTARQSASRSAHAELSREWAGLTDAVRDDWDTFAALPENVVYDYWGNPFYLSGFNWFIKIQRACLYLGEIIPQPVPSSDIPDLPPPLEVTIDPMDTVAGSAISALAPWQYAGAWVYVKAAIWTSLGQRNPPMPLFLYDIVPIMDFPAYPWDAQLVARFGDQQETGRWFFRFWCLTPDFRPGPWRDYSGIFGDTVTD